MELLSSCRRRRRQGGQGLATGEASCLRAVTGEWRRRPIRPSRARTVSSICVQEGPGWAVSGRAACS